MIRRFFVVGIAALAILVVSAVGLPAQKRPRRPRLAPHEGVPLPRSEAAYRSPVTRPASILQGNGGSFSHQGKYGQYAWDFTLRIGSPVVATRAGVVRVAKQLSRIGGGDKSRFVNEANKVVIDHLDGSGANYLHFQHGSLTVRVGEWVAQGELLGLSGDTGWASSPHLHYTATKRRGGASIPSKFVDFQPAGGVPRKGDRVVGAAKPAPRQKVIDTYRRIDRAARAAERSGWLGIAFRFAEKPPVRRPPQGYFYEAVRVKRRARLESRLVARLRDFARREDLTEADRREAQRLTQSLGETSVEALRLGVAALQAAMAKWPPAHRLNAWDQTAMKHWVEGLAFECEGNTKEAMRRYATAIKKGSDVMKPIGWASLERIVRKGNAERLNVMKRLLYEAPRALSVHRSRLKDAARDTWRASKQSLRDWKKQAPDRKRDADAMLAAMRARYQAVQKAIDR